LIVRSPHLAFAIRNHDIAILIFNGAGEGEDRAMNDIRFQFQRRILDILRDIRAEGRKVNNSFFGP